MDVKKVSFRRLSLTIIIILLTAIVFGGLIWWQYKPLIDAKSDYIKSLENQITNTTEKIHKL